MNLKLAPIDESLRKLREAISAHPIPEDIQANFGPQSAPLGKATFLRIVDLALNQLAAAPSAPLPVDVLADVPEMKRQLDQAAINLVPQLAGPNAVVAAPSLMSLIWSVQLRLSPALAWSALPPDEKIPAPLLARMRVLSSTVEKLEEGIGAISKQKEAAEEVFAALQATITKANEFVASMEGIGAQTGASREQAQKASLEAVVVLEQIQKSLQQVSETQATLGAAAEKAAQAAKQIDESAIGVATATGQVGAQSESVAQMEQKLAASVDAGAKAREKVIGDAEHVSSLVPQLNKHHEEIAAKAAEIVEVTLKVRETSSEIASTLEEARKAAADAEDWASKSNDAFQIVTTAGLAGAFNQRANALTRNSLVWVLALGAALVVAAIIGNTRSLEISELLRSGKTDPSILLVQMVLSILTVGAPIWMAWLATKQVGHYFRLAEDYGFKASVAKAYEGYREEAVRLDPQFQARLFASALQRFDENPLRFVSPSEAGTPMQELLQQPWFQEAIEQVPNFKDRLIGFLTRAPKKAMPTVGIGMPAKATEQPASVQGGTG